MHCTLTILFQTWMMWGVCIEMRYGERDEGRDHRKDLVYQMKIDISGLPFF